MNPSWARRSSVFFVAMRRALVLAGVIVVGMLAMVPALAPAAEAPIRKVEFKFHADGFLVTMKNEVTEEKVELTFFRHGEVAYYVVPAEITEDTLKARFGRLGELDYTFTPTRSGDCAGAYEGTFDFTGENDYVSFEVGRLRGTLDGPATKSCKPPGGRKVRMHTTTETEEAHGDEEASLLAHTGRPLPVRSLVVFEGESKGRRRVLFSGFEYEEEEGMTIARGAQAAGPPRDFTWNLKAGTARIAPPAPFSGSATFKRRSGGHSTWSGSLRVPVPGGQPMRLAGGAFKAQLIKGSLLD
jgi:hypothetical protein